MSAPINEHDSGSPADHWDSDEQIDRFREMIRTIEFDGPDFHHALAEAARGGDRMALSRASNAIADDTEYTLFVMQQSRNPLVGFIIPGFLSTLLLIPLIVPLLYGMARATDMQRAVVSNGLSSGILMLLITIYNIAAFIAIRASVSDKDQNRFRCTMLRLFNLANVRMSWVLWRVALLAKVNGIPNATLITAIVPLDTIDATGEAVKAIRIGEDPSQYILQKDPIRSVALTSRVTTAVAMIIVFVVLFRLTHQHA